MQRSRWLSFTKPRSAEAEEGEQGRENVTRLRRVTLLTVFAIVVLMVLWFSRTLRQFVAEDDCMDAGGVTTGNTASVSARGREDDAGRGPAPPRGPPDVGGAG